MNHKSFIDTDIWIYAHLENDDEKNNQALTLLDSLSELAISTQVLNEYFGNPSLGSSSFENDRKLELPILHFLLCPRG